MSNNCHICTNTHALIYTITHTRGRACTGVHTHTIMYKNKHKLLTFFSHADLAAFFESARLAFPSHPHVHLEHALPLGFASVRLLGSSRDGSSEEAFASFAREGVVVVAGSPISADQAQLLFPLSNAVTTAAAAAAAAADAA